jgi:molybdenum cofactor cytidylyltransferase
MRLVAVLLAAGEGKRFGGGKLAADLAGRPLIDHAAATLAAIPLAGRIAVVSPETPDLSAFGFASVLVPYRQPQSRSLAAGVRAAEAAEADAALIALADMPLVPVAHLMALIAAFGGDRIATRSFRILPPAIFGRHYFDSLGALTGDTGARDLLTGAPSIDLDPALAIDIDTPEDLARANRWFDQRAGIQST